MKKRVPLIQLKADGRRNTIISADRNTVSQHSFPVSNIHYNVVYDSASGILYVQQPDGTLLETSGMNTRHTIGMGETGFSGNSGTEGDDGLPGINGVDGSEGKRGFTGPRGYRGLQGEQGYIGEQGSRGPIGYDGPKGPSGQQGVLGFKGITGEKGYRGRDRDLYLVFSETPPDHALNTGGIWHKIKTRTYSAESRAQCGGKQVQMSSFVLPTQRSLETRGIIAPEIPTPCWRFIEFDPKDYHNNVDLLERDSNGEILVNLKNYCTALFAESSDSITVSNKVIPYFDGTPSEFSLPDEISNYVWKNSNTAWSKFDPIIDWIVIDADTQTYYSSSKYSQDSVNLEGIIPLDSKHRQNGSLYGLNNTSIQFVYYDRVGTNPGIRLLDL